MSQPKRRRTYPYRGPRRIISTTVRAVPASEEELSRRASDVVSILLGARASDGKRR